MDWITQGWWSYPLLVATIAGSSLFPPVPSESAMVTAMSLATAGKLSLVLVCLASATGSIFGDILAYGLGRGVRPRAERSRRGRKALRWLKDREAGWAPGMIMAGRFVPGGASAVAISAGIAAYPFHRFTVFAVLGALVWTGYGVALALLGWAIFPGNPWASTALAVGVVLCLSGLLHIHRVRRRGKGR